LGWSLGSRRLKNALQKENRAFEDLRKSQKLKLGLPPEVKEKCLSEREKVGQEDSQHGKRRNIDVPWVFGWNRENKGKDQGKRTKREGKLLVTKSRRGAVSSRSSASDGLNKTKKLCAGSLLFSKLEGRRGRREKGHAEVQQRGVRRGEGGLLQINKVVRDNNAKGIRRRDCI